jgi:hypothetical protein
VDQKIDWRHNGDTGSWKTTVGRLRAVVLHMTAGDWYPYVEQISLPHDRRDGPHFTSAGEARAWCETEIARLQRQTP